MNANTKVIFLDWDGTICDSRFWGHWAGDAQYGSSYDLLQQRFFREMPKKLDEWMRGMWTSEEIVRQISTLINLPVPEILAGLQESCQHMTFISDTILPLVAILRSKGVIVAIATDNMDTFTRWTVPTLGLNDHFDAILSSYALQSLKSEKDLSGQSTFFANYLRQMEVSPEQTILIDDSAHNASVKDFGMGFLQVTSEYPIDAILARF